MDEKHEDAFKAANQWAGRVTNVGETLSKAVSHAQAEQLLQESRVLYQNLFEAFIAGVEWARVEAAKEKSDG